jgi:hydrogenase maturation protein HypF
MAEHGLEGSVLGVAYDGTGYGPDGAAWGGELLRADGQGFERIATFRPIPLAGGEVAIRQVWRIALALLEDAFDGDPPLAQLPLFAQVAQGDLRVVRRMLGARVRCAPAHGVGRYFDAIGSLVLMRSESDFQGEVASAWEAVAGAGDAAPYSFAITEEFGCLELDLRAMVREVVRDHMAGRPAGEISRRFHETLATATAALVHEAGAAELPVVLSGGCFQNDLLTRSVLRQLEGRAVYRHCELPPGDGGIALGQALVADARVAEDSPCA